MYPYEWTLETDYWGSSRYLPSPPHWQLGMRLRIQRPNTPIFFDSLMLVQRYFAAA